MSDLVKVAAFAVILAALLGGGYFARKWLSWGMNVLRMSAIFGRFCGNRWIRTDTDGNLFELTKVSIPDYVLIWIWLPVFLRIYLWQAIAWFVATIDYRISRMPIDPWNRAGEVPKAMLAQVDSVLNTIDGSISIWLGFYYIVAVALVLYAAIRFCKLVYSNPLRSFCTVLALLLSAIILLYVGGYLLGGAFAGLQRLDFQVATIEFPKPPAIPGLLWQKFLQVPIRFAVWVSFAWWFTSYVYSSLFARYQYVPSMKELRLMNWDGLEAYLQNYLPVEQPILAVISPDGESNAVETKAKSKDGAPKGPRFKIQWAYSTIPQFILLFGGMRFIDEMTHPGERPVFEVSGFPWMYFMLRKFLRQNVAPATDRPLTKSDAGKKGRRPVRAAAGKVGRGLASSVRGAVRFTWTGSLRKAPKPAAAPVELPDEPVEEPVQPLAKQA